MTLKPLDGGVVLFAISRQPKPCTPLRLLLNRPMLDRRCSRRRFGIAELLGPPVCVFGMMSLGVVT